VELKVLIELSRRQLRGKSGARISSRELAKACRIGRSNVVMAIDSLTNKNHIYMRQGTPTTPASYHVNIFETVKMGGPKIGPPPQERWSQNETTVDLFQDQGGPVLGPPRDENKGDSISDGRVDRSAAIETILDRVLRSKPGHFDRASLTRGRKWMHGYLTTANAGWMTDEREPADPNIHPPDDFIVAQFLAVGEWPALEAMLKNLFSERKKPEQNYAWFVTTALSRCHGIHWTMTAKAREQLRLVKRGQQLAGELPDRQASEQLTMDLAAGAKKLG
jgi:hypothetical protein